MEAHEKAAVLGHLNSCREQLLKLVDGLTPEQWQYEPAEGRWSVNQCMEHVVRVENRVLGNVQKKLGDGADELDKPRVDDNVLLQAVQDRSVVRQAPEPARPVGQWPNADELLAEFASTRQRTIDFASTAPDNLRNHLLPHGAFGDLDCYQWLLLLGLHGKRHAQQIEEIKATPGFPA
jgi:DinB superfamily